MLQWCGNPESAFREVWRVMKPSSLFLFATLGPDTLKELRDCWNAVDTLSHVNEFADMHEVGDLLVLCGFEAPVLEMEYFTLNYADVFSLMRDLKRLGAVNINMGTRLSLTGKGRMRHLVQEYERYPNIIDSRWFYIFNFLDLMQINRLTMKQIGSWCKFGLE